MDTINELDDLVGYNEQMVISEELKQAVLGQLRKLEQDTALTSTSNFWMAQRWERRSPP